MQKKEVAAKTLDVLKALYPNPRPHLMASDPWELLVATVLAAQCTDARVNQITPALFKRLPSVRDFATVPLEELEGLIRSTGFYHNKAKNLIAAAQRVVSVYDGKVPETMADLITLGGVARKTANVVLWSCFGKNEGLAVDTHVGRISVRLGLSKPGSQLQIEKALCAVFPRAEWGNVNHRMVSFGRDVCMARSPQCQTCPMRDFCSKTGVTTIKPSKKPSA